MTETNYASNFLDTFRTNFSKDVRDPLLTPTILKEFVNKDFEIVSGNTVRVFMWPSVVSNTGSLAARNNYDKIARQSGQPTYEEFTVDEYLDFNVVLTKFDQKISEIPKLSENLVRQIRRNNEQVAEIDIASNFVNTNVRNIMSAVTTNVAGAVTAGATVFSVKAGDGALIAVGDICFIEATAGNTIAVLVKSKSTDAITIETNPALFPTGPGGKKFFRKLAVALPAISDLAICKTDAPLTIDKTSYYDALVDLWDKPLELDVPAGDFLTFSPLAPTRLLKKDDSVLLTNQDIGKDVIINGDFRRLGGNQYYNGNNGISRVDGAGVTRYYPWVQKRGQSVIHVDYLSSEAVDLIQETAGAVLSTSGVQSYQSKVIKNHGAKTMAFGCFKI